LKPSTGSSKLRLHDCFECRARRKQVSVEECLNDYVDADIQKHKRRACYQCITGQNIRIEFAGNN
jgi:hypothetical protein